VADIRGILFDKDGTLVDFQKTWFAIGDQLALQAAHGDRAGADRLLAEAGYDFAASCFRADSVFAAGTNADVVALWYPAASGAERRRLLASFDVFTADQVASRSVALPGSREAIASLHGAGFRLGVATNDSTRGAERTLLALGVAQMFDAVYGYDAVASPKPAPDIILAFCDLTGLGAGEIAVVGDNRHDLEMARAGGAGLAVAVLSGTGTRETLRPLADVVINSVADLPACLAQRKKSREAGGRRHGSAPQPKR
jgi:phosphoglycolate phosphatase